MNGKFGCIGLIGALLLGLFVFSQVFTSTTYGEIRMVQPNGITVERDHRYSETNLNNSWANENNAQANRINAQATQIVGNTNPPYFETFQLGACSGIVAFIVLIVFGYVLIRRLETL